MKLKFFTFLFFVFTSFNSYAISFNGPFYVSLRSNEINLRTGPGNEYPIKYVYQLKGMPLKVMGEYDGWYKTIDKDGDEGWISKNLTTKRKTLIVINGTQIMYKKDDLKSNPIFRLEENVIVDFIKCDKEWCKVEIKDKKGWIQKEFLWGYEL